MKEPASKLIYLASPRTHESGETRNARFDAACRCAAKLMEAGHAVFSPIAHTVPVSAQSGDGA